MSALDVIPIPGHPGMYARRVFVEAWQAAGSPPLNSAGRLYGKQKEFYDGWVNRLPGFNPADNPDDETQRLAHVRFAAGDIDPTPDRIRRLTAAGLIRPYSYEPWHWELPNVRQYAIVRSIPTTGGTAAPTESEEDDDMRTPAMFYTTKNDLPATASNPVDTYIITDTNGYYSPVSGVNGDYASRLTRAYGITVDAQLITRDHARRIERDCAAMRPRSS